MTKTEKKIEAYKSFWKRENKKPLIGYSIGNYFISKRFRAAEPLLEDGKKITPNMIDVNTFKNDYLRMAELWDEEEHDILFTATPFPGLPWLEAIMGADVYATNNSFISHTDKYQNISELRLDTFIDNRWLDKYLEFCTMLKELSDNKFPVGQPILRGPSDVLGSLVGQDRLVFYFYDSPDVTKNSLKLIAERFLELIYKQYEIIDDFYGGFSMGFYDLWCPGACMWFQDDLNALFSPSIYEDYIIKSHQYLANSYIYTMFHLHPASIYMIDYLLTIDELNAVQINKDVGGPSVREMLPHFEKVLAKKNLIIWGDFTESEIDFLNKSLVPQGLYIIIFKD